ncbi:hypothetical protein [Streptomyces sp. NPDC012746]|uniref:hypothetical protein n=1 Tax=Streptomyces sp. NPDC012746 TaxID=3364845 RepID=UPI0036B47A70
MSTTARHVLSRPAAGLAAAVHHIATSTAALVGVVGWAAVSYLDGRTTEAVIAAALGSLLCAEWLRAEFRGAPFTACPLCTLARRGARKEITQ